MMNTKILCFPGARNSFGNKSVNAVMKLSTITNWVKTHTWFSLLLEEANYFSQYNVAIIITCVSTVRRMSMRKKQMLQNCGNGIIAVAWGYAMKAKPGPVKSSRRTRPTGAQWKTGIIHRLWEIGPHLLCCGTFLVRLLSQHGPFLPLRPTNATIHSGVITYSPPEQFWWEVRWSYFTRFYHCVDTDTLFLGHKSQYGKDNKTSQKTGPAVEQT